ncbi:MAG: heme ABC exporter ATP-binding protein CcmA [Parvibaculaceae bacterium]
MALTAEDLSCQRGGRTVFRDVQFELGNGEALIVTGPNGAGKSSLLRLLAGLVEVANGSLKLTGGASETILSEQAHYIGHLDALKTAMSVHQTMQFWSDFFGGDVRDTDHALEVFDLRRLVDLPVAYLSAGQRRRLSLSRLLLARRPLWLLDEPSVALDAASLARLLSVIEAHQVQGGMIIATTHQPLGLTRAKILELGSQMVSS